MEHFGRVGRGSAFILLAFLLAPAAGFAAGEPAGRPELLVEEPGPSGLARGPEWRLVSTPTSPAARAVHALAPLSSSARDKSGGNVLLFGGSVSGAFSDETWTFTYQTEEWWRLQTPTTPPARANHALAPLGPGRGILMYGGNGTGRGPGLADTWIFDTAAGDWRSIPGAGGPGARVAHAMAWDPLSQKAILFGGLGENGTARNDTWAFDPLSERWSEVPATGAPSPRWRHSLAFSSAFGKVILAGGLDGGTYSLDLQARQWTDIKALSPPRGQFAGSLAYFEEIGWLVHYGGAVDASPPPQWTLSGDTNHLDEPGDGKWWYWNSATRPPARAAHSMAYDPVNKGIVMFGGVNSSASHLAETWILDYKGQQGTPPKVLFTTPAPGSTDVATDSEVRVTFSELMDPAETAAAFSIRPAVNGSSVLVRDYTLYFTHNAKFDEARPYEVTISTLARSVAGTQMAGPHRFAFTTAGPPTFALSGRITDEGGAGVAGAQVEVLAAPSGAVVAAGVSGQHGAFRFTLSKGEYRVRAVYPDGTVVLSEPVTIDADATMIVSRPAPAGPWSSPSTLLAVGLAGTLGGLALAFLFGSEALKLALLLVPIALYTRIRKDRVLDHFLRGQIYGRISENPGKTYGELLADLGIGNGTLAHHIYILRRAGLVRSEKEGKFTRFYPTGIPTKKAGALLSQVQRAIVAEVAKQPGLKLSEMARRMKMRNDSFTYNVRQLAVLGMVRLEGWGLEKRLFPGDKDDEPSPAGSASPPAA
jgi:DNA-binding transcriptional ArsR family regulator